MNTPATTTIRPYRPEDLDALYDVCLKTGDTGEDATHLYRDPKLLGHLYAAPYAVLEPDLTFVLEDRGLKNGGLEDSGGICGYILGAFDSRTFYKRLETEWFPPLRKQYPKPINDESDWIRDERIVKHFYDEPPESPFFEAYPAHLHIDILPRAQGSGNGRALMETFLAALTEKGSPGVHLGTSPQNTRAEQFYLKMGFHELKRQEPHTLVMGKRLVASGE